jgi:hypothetical protein
MMQSQNLETKEKFQKSAISEAILTNIEQKFLIAVLLFD